MTEKLAAGTPARQTTQPTFDECRIVLDKLMNRRGRPILEMLFQKYDSEARYQVAMLLGDIAKNFDVNDPSGPQVPLKLTPATAVAEPTPPSTGRPNQITPDIQELFDLEEQHPPLVGNRARHHEPVSGEGTGTLTQAIMNLPIRPSNAVASQRESFQAYLLGHRDARHDAAELAADVDATLAAKQHDIEIRDEVIEGLRLEVNAKDAQLAELRAKPVLTEYIDAVRSAANLAAGERNRWESVTDQRTFEHWQHVVVMLNALLLVIESPPEGLYGEKAESTLADLRRQGAEKEQTAWLVALGSMPPQWWTGRGDEFTTDIDGTKLNPAKTAMRFARREDAERAIGWLVKKGVCEGCRAEEHLWL